MANNIILFLVQVMAMIHEVYFITLSNILHLISSMSTLQGCHIFFFVNYVTSKDIV